MDDTTDHIEERVADFHAMSTILCTVGTFIFLALLAGLIVILA